MEINGYRCHITKYGQEFLLTKSANGKFLLNKSADGKKLTLYAINKKITGNDKPIECYKEVATKEYKGNRIIKHTIEQQENYNPVLERSSDIPIISKIPEGALSEFSIKEYKGRIGFEMNGTISPQGLIEDLYVLQSDNILGSYPFCRMYINGQFLSGLARRYLRIFADSITKTLHPTKTKNKQNHSLTA